MVSEYGSHSHRFPPSILIFVCFPVFLNSCLETRSVYLRVRVSQTKYHENMYIDIFPHYFWIFLWIASPPPNFVAIKNPPVLCWPIGFLELFLFAGICVSTVGARHFPPSFFGGFDFFSPPVHLSLSLLLPQIPYIRFSRSSIFF